LAIRLYELKERGDIGENTLVVFNKYSQLPNKMVAIVDYHEKVNKRATPHPAYKYFAEFAQKGDANQKRAMED